MHCDLIYVELGAYSVHFAVKTVLVAYFVYHAAGFGDNALYKQTFYCFHYFLFIYLFIHLFILLINITETSTK